MLNQTHSARSCYSAFQQLLLTKPSACISVSSCFGPLVDESSTPSLPRALTSRIMQCTAQCSTLLLLSASRLCKSEPPSPIKPSSYLGDTSGPFPSWLSPCQPVAAHSCALRSAPRQLNSHRSVEGLHRCWCKPPPQSSATRAPNSRQQRQTASAGQAGWEQEAIKIPLMPGSGLMKHAFALLLLCLASAWSQAPSKLPYVWAVPPSSWSFCLHEA